MDIPFPPRVAVSVEPNRSTVQAVDRLFREQCESLYTRTDRMLAVLMLLQWVASIAVAFWISPRTWSGASSSVHPHVWLALWLGGALSSFPVLLAWLQPGRVITRHAIAVGQMLTSALLVHLSGGRIETHFHVFGSLAFLAFYRDWPVLVTAAVTVAAEHWFRGAYWPESIYGVALASHWRWVEHAGWVVFELSVLIPGCIRSVQEMRQIAVRQADLEAANRQLEADAAERRRLMESLRDSEREFRSLAQAIPQLVWTATPDGVPNYYNERWEEYTGLSMAQTIHEGWAGVVHPEDRAAAETCWNHSIATGGSYEVEYRLRCAEDGEYRWHLSRGTAVRNDQGEIQKWFGTVTEIHERKQAEQEIRQAQEALRRAHDELELRVTERTAELTATNSQLQQEVTERQRAEADSARLVAILESTSDLVGISDAQFRTQYLNQAGYELLGIPREEALSGRESRNAYTEAAWETSQKEIVPTLLREGIWSGEITLRSRDGQEIPTSQVVVAHRSSEGQVEFFSTIARDITEQRRAEAALREREEMLRSFYNSAPMMMGVVELEDEEVFHVSANAAVGARYGIDANDLIGRSATELGATEETMQLWMEQYGQTLHSGQPVRFEYEAFDEPGRWIAVSVSYIGLGPNGRQRFSYVAEDVSDARHAAEALRTYAYQLEASRDRIEAQAGILTQQAEEISLARDQALEASRAKSAFLANMSHELRTPLNAILGYSEMLLEDAQDSGNDEAVPDLEKIRGAGEHLLGLISDILDLSKIEAGKMDLHLESFPVAGMIETVLSTARPLVAKNGNRLEVRGLDGMGQMFADQQKVRQVLLNLLSNAAKFTHEGRITLQTRREREDGQERLRIDLSDTGIGMTEEQVGRLFQEFTQGDDSTTRKYGGTGLGLAITRRFCELMGGSVTVTSREGEGSTFTVWLPAVVTPPAERRPANASTAPTAEGAGGCVDPEGEPLILVIDDDPTVHDLLRRSLTREGFRVEIASNGEEGLRRAWELRPAAITLDVMMPGIDGWAVLAALKHDAELREIPVVMLTMVDDRSRGYTLGVADYVTKPFQRDRLVEVLRRHCRNEGGGSVLVVEDDPQYRSLLRETLSLDGREVLEAEDGIEALYCMESNTPDLILLDLGLPRMDGFEFLAELTRRGGPTPPVVVLSGCFLSAEDRTRLSGGADVILEKNGTQVTQLLERVRKELASTVGRTATLASSHS